MNLKITLLKRTIINFKKNNLYKSQNEHKKYHSSKEKRKKQGGKTIAMDH